MVAVAAALLIACRHIDKRLAVKAGTSMVCLQQVTLDHKLMSKAFCDTLRNHHSLSWITQQ